MMDVNTVQTPGCVSLLCPILPLPVKGFRDWHSASDSHCIHI